MSYTRINQNISGRSQITKEILPTRYNSISSTKMSTPNETGINSTTQIKVPSSQKKSSDETTATAFDVA